MKLHRLSSKYSLDTICINSIHIYKGVTLNIVKVRKNFLLDKEVIEKAQSIIVQKHKNLTEVINLYFKAIVKEPSILDTIEKSANKRTGSFIGLLDGHIGDESYKTMKKETLKESYLS